MNPLHQRDARPPSAARAHDADRALPTLEAQQLWFRVRRFDWTSLVLVPSGPGTSTGEIAARLYEAGRVLSEGPVALVQTESMDFEAIADLVLELSSRPKLARTAPDQKRTVISIHSVLEKPLATGIAQAADAALLCVQLRQASLADGRATLDLVGRERFVGSVLLRHRKP